MRSVDRMAMAYKVDTSVWEEQAEMFAAAKREFGRIDYGASLPPSLRVADSPRSLCQRRFVFSNISLVLY